MTSAEPSNLKATQSTSVDNDHMNDNDPTDLKTEQDYLDESDNESELSDTNPLQCRMYEDNYPEQGDLVMIKINHIFDKGAYCNLLEYNNIEGVLLNTELVRKRIRKSIKSLIPPGTEHIVQVLKVDRDQQYINLSKKRVEQDDIIEFNKTWNKSKMSHSIMRQIAYNPDLKYSMKQLYKMFGWKCADDFGHLYDAFKDALNNWNEFVAKYPFIAKDAQICLQKMIEKRLKAEKVTVRAEIEMTCFTFEGVDAIKRALKAGFAVVEMHNEKKDKEGLDVYDISQLKISLKSSPLFYVSAVTFEPEKGKVLVGNVIEVMNKSICESGGALSVKMEADVIAMNEIK
eukprot:1471_1